MSSMSEHPLFYLQLVPFLVVIVCLIMRFVFKKKIGDFLGLSCLIAIFLGLINYFYFGVPLDEGTLNQTQIPDYEFKFTATCIGLLISVSYPIFSLIALILSPNKKS